MRGCLREYGIPYDKRRSDPHSDLYTEYRCRYCCEFSGMDGGSGSDFLELYMPAEHFYNETFVLAGENPYSAGDPLDQRRQQLCQRSERIFPRTV